MKQVTAAKVAAVAVAAVLTATGAVRMYIFTAPPNAATTNPLPLSTSSMGGTSQSAAPECGYQDASGRPQGCWSRYLGFLPGGYVLPPHCVNCPMVPCPSGMNLGECKQFRASCGNGVCDPDESCSSCPIDCLPGQLACSSYTGRPMAPTMSDICQVTPNATIG